MYGKGGIMFDKQGLTLFGTTVPWVVVAIVAVVVIVGGCALVKALSR